jgi:CubicO group peptidase (beta-lactamase class C family)
MAERVVNDSWESLIEKRLFDLLGIESCGFGAMGTAGKIDQPWQHTLLRTMHRPVEPSPRADNAPVIGPAGTLHCSVIDWGKFVTAHLRGEQGLAGILKPEAFKRLHTPPFGGDYGFGWMVVDRPWAGGRALTHGQQHHELCNRMDGSSGGFRRAGHDEPGRRRNIQRL